VSPSQSEQPERGGRKHAQARGSPCGSQRERAALPGANGYDLFNSLVNGTGPSAVSKARSAQEDKKKGAATRAAAVGAGIVGAAATGVVVLAEQSTGTGTGTRWLGGCHLNDWLSLPLELGA